MTITIATSAANSVMKGAKVHLRTFVVSNSSTTDVSFTNIPQNYTDLVLVSFVRRTESANLSNLLISPNSAVATGGSTVYLLGNGSSPSTSRHTSQDAWFTGTIPGGTSTANLFGYSTLEIFDYTSSSKFKTALSKTTSDIGGTAGEVAIRAHLLRSQNSITTLTASTFSVSNYFAVGSTFSLYGIRSVNQ